MNPDEEKVRPWALGLYRRPELLKGSGLKVHLKEQPMHPTWGVILKLGWALVLCIGHNLKRIYFLL